MRFKKLMKERFLNRIGVIEDHDYAMYIKYKDEMELYNATADKGKTDVEIGKEKPVLIQTILSDSTPESL